MLKVTSEERIKKFARTMGHCPLVIQVFVATVLFNLCGVLGVLGATYLFMLLCGGPIFIPFAMAEGADVWFLWPFLIYNSIGIFGCFVGFWSIEASNYIDQEKFMFLGLGGTCGFYFVVFCLITW